MTFEPPFFALMRDAMRWATGGLLGMLLVYVLIYSPLPAVPVAIGFFILLGAVGFTLLSSLFSLVRAFGALDDPALEFWLVIQMEEYIRGLKA